MTSARRSQHGVRRGREGYVTLLVVGALLVVFGVGAVAVDQLWLSHAKVELQASADASCLAAARTLVTDDTLREDLDWETVVERAMENAQRVSKLNDVAGGKLELRPGPDGDVWFGQYLLDRETGQRRFVFTDYAPDTVIVRAERTRDTDNPVRMMMGGVFGVHWANVSTKSEVTIDNHIVGVRAGNDLPVPALPFAILAGSDDSDEQGASDDEESDSTDDDANSGTTSDDETEDAAAAPRTDTWVNAIDERGGDDEYGWDAERDVVVERGDGIPEIVVRPMRRKGRPEEANLQLLDFGSDFRTRVLDDQCEHGLNEQHLADFGGELIFDGRRIETRCTANVRPNVINLLRPLVGQTRLCFLYDDHEPYGQVGEGELRLVRLVAVRILDVRRSNGEFELVLQPAVVATRTTVLHEDWEWADDEAALRNPYVFQLTVTQ